MSDVYLKVKQVDLLVRNVLGSELLEYFERSCLKGTEVERSEERQNKLLNAIAVLDKIIEIFKTETIKTITEEDYYGTNRSITKEQEM